VGDSLSALIITANSPYAESLATALAIEFHWRISTAPTFRIALAEVRNRRFDLVIVDRELDGGDGLVIAPIVKSRYPECRTILLNHHQRWATSEAALTLGFDHILDYNFTVHDLEELLRHSSEGIEDYSPLKSLTTRELEILSDIAQGMRSNEIARAREITEATVKTHLTSIYRKLGVRNRVEAVARFKDS
jgi:DNA-binding NarL/FixJ family response regulator